MWLGDLNSQGWLPATSTWGSLLLNGIGTRFASLATHMQCLAVPELGNCLRSVLGLLETWRWRWEPGKHWESTGKDCVSVLRGDWAQHWEHTWVFHCLSHENENELIWSCWSHRCRELIEWNKIWAQKASPGLCSPATSYIVHLHKSKL